jgi:hypothetical protein
MNSIQIFAGSGLSIAFGFFAVSIGYTDAWIFAGVIGLATLPLLIWVSGSRGSPALTPSGRLSPPDPRR